MITSVRQSVRYTPRDLCDDDGQPIEGAPVYIIDPPTVFTRSEWNRALMNIGARQVTSSDLLAVLRRGIREVVDEAQREELLTFVQEFEDSSQGLDEQVTSARQIIDEHGEESDLGKEAARSLVKAIDRHSDLVGRMDDLEGQIRIIYPPYARKLGDQSYWMENAPVIAAQLFLVAGENTDVEVVRERGRVPNDILDALPRNHVREIGWHAVRLMFPDQDDAKNSARPSSSASSRKPSARTKKARGTSGVNKSMNGPTRRTGALT